MRFISILNTIFLLSSCIHVTQAMHYEKELKESSEQLRESTDQLLKHLEEIREHPLQSRDCVTLGLQLGSKIGCYKVCRQPIRAVHEQKGSIEKHFDEIREYHNKCKLKTMLSSIKGKTTKLS